MPTGGANDADEVRRQFQEALARKHAREHASRAGGAKDSGKPHEAHGPAKIQRTFRRKSG